MGQRPAPALRRPSRRRWASVSPRATGSLTWGCGASPPGRSARRNSLRPPGRSRAGLRRRYPGRARRTAGWGQRAKSGPLRRRRRAPRHRRCGLCCRQPGSQGPHGVAARPAPRQRRAAWRGRGQPEPSSGLPGRRAERLVRSTARPGPPLTGLPHAMLPALLSEVLAIAGMAMGAAGGTCLPPPAHAAGLPLDLAGRGVVGGPWPEAAVAEWASARTGAWHRPSRAAPPPCGDVRRGRAWFPGSSSGAPRHPRPPRHTSWPSASSDSRPPPRRHGAPRCSAFRSVCRGSFACHPRTPVLDLRRRLVTCPRVVEYACSRACARQRSPRG
mmetsp:Transcript_105515/g.293803  ORF Transcript_105515/g.293803 Transcript_105515/m.293803 type:complete len:329 (-) Transcript_105515:26-1012(-)